jgi:hypothetical protein
VDSFSALRGTLPFGRVTAVDLDVTVELGGDGPPLEDEGRSLLAWLSGRATTSRIAVPAPEWPPVPAVDWSQAP